MGTDFAALTEVGVLFWHPGWPSSVKDAKYKSAVMDEQVLDALRSFTTYDQEVYDYARDLAGRPRDPFYANYREYFLYEGLGIYMSLMFCSCAILLACRCSFNLCFRLSSDVSLFSSGRRFVDNAYGKDAERAE